MTECTSLDAARKLAGVEFYRTCKDYEGRIHVSGENGKADQWYFLYRSDTLLVWLLSHGDSIEITPDIEGFNCTFWKDHYDYNGVNIFLADALAEVVLKVPMGGQDAR